jgi:hypothetical protein
VLLKPSTSPSPLKSHQTTCILSLAIMPAGLHFADLSLTQLGLLSWVLPQLVKQGTRPYLKDPAINFKKLHDRVQSLTETPAVEPAVNLGLLSAISNGLTTCVNLDEEQFLKAFRDAGLDVKQLVSMQDVMFKAGLTCFQYPEMLQIPQARQAREMFAGMLAGMGFTFKEEPAEVSDTQSIQGSVAPEEPTSVFSGTGRSGPTERGSLTEDEGTEDEGTEDEIKRTDKGSTLTPSNRDSVSSVYRVGSLPP